MHIYVVRHTAYSNPKNVYAFYLPFNLSEEGRSHAAKIGNWFQKNSLNKIPIYSSPIVRCVQTSEIIASKTQSFVSIDERLIETSCPPLQGVKNTSSKLEEDSPSRESRKSILTRILSIFEEKKNLGKDCILVTHGDVITLLNFHLRDEKVPRYLWGEKRSKYVVDRGDVLDIEIINESIKSINHISNLN